MCFNFIGGFVWSMSRGLLYAGKESGIYYRDRSRVKVLLLEIRAFVKGLLT